LITGLQGPEDRVKGIEAGCDDFLSKPYNNLELLARVQSLLKVKDYNDLMSNYQKDLESEVTGRTEELKHTLENLQQEITERKRTEEALRASEELFRNYLEYAPDGVYMSDVKGTFLYGNRRCEEIIGYRREELIGKNFLELNLLTEKSLNKAAQLLQANMEGKPTGPDEIELISKEGRLIPVEISTSMVQHMDQGIVLAFVRDITDRKQMEEKIRQMAYHDYLTGLPNRKLFYDRLGIALAQSQRNQKKVGIVMLDLDNFKGVNDTLGHDVGDLLLKAAVDRLSSALRKGDTVARFGGDEFVLIFPDLKGIEDAILVAQKIVDSFHKPFLIDTHQLVVTTSIGIAVYPNDGIDEDILLRNADIAMYQAKQAGRDRYQLCKKA
jgi:diguanylate cyclase (GGDEF)-like protein/PAS domain S-box-containing protein